MFAGNRRRLAWQKVEGHAAEGWVIVSIVLKVIMIREWKQKNVFPYLPPCNNVGIPCGVLNKISDVSTKFSFPTLILVIEEEMRAPKVVIQYSEAIELPSSCNTAGGGSGVALGTSTHAFQ
jgi:hypothetical protein